MITRRELLACTGMGATLALGATAHVRAGCSTSGWDLDPSRFETVLQALTEIRDLGFSGFETHLRYLRPQMNRQEEARAEIASKELVFLGVQVNLPNLDELGLDRALEDFGRQAMAAKQFGAKSIMASGATKDPKFVDAVAMRSLEMGVTFVLRVDNAATLVEQTNPKTVYFAVGAADVEFFQNHPGRTFAIHLENEDGLREIASAARKTKWISWLVHEGKSSPADSRAAMKKVFGV